ncbi:MAG: hypothetical protein K6L75_01045 [Cellvibrionaceae bacterium]
MIGKEASTENINEIKKKVISLYLNDGYFQPSIEVKKDSQFPNIYQAIVVEPILLGFEVKGGNSDIRSKAVNFLNSLLGGSIVNEKTFTYLENALESRLGVGINIEHSLLDQQNQGFNIVVKIVGSINSTLSVSNEGTNRLGREIISAEVQLVEQVSGFKSVYISTFNTLKTDGYRSIGAGFNSGVSKNNELIFDLNISRGRYENLFDKTVPDVVYDRRFMKLGWQFQPSESNSFSNAVFLNIISNDLEREQYTTDFEEKLRSVEVGYWQQNVWQGNTLYWQITGEQGLDSLGAKLEGPLADSNVEIDYSLFRARLAFNQNLPWDIGVRTDLQGQYTEDFLPFTQRYTIANDSLVRAFESGEINGDSGIAAKIEISKGEDLALLSSRFVPYGYYSLGKVRDNINTESITAASVGLGIRWFNRHVFSFVELGKPLEEDSIYRTDSPRIRAAVRLYF